eukprot:4159845-Alexandrium_andersonii.AAC.1
MSFTSGAISGATMSGCALSLACRIFKYFRPCASSRLTCWPLAPMRSESSPERNSRQLLGAAGPTTPAAPPKPRRSGWRRSRHTPACN